MKLHSKSLQFTVALTNVRGKTIFCVTTCTFCIYINSSNNNDDNNEEEKKMCFWPVWRCKSTFPLMIRNALKKERVVYNWFLRVNHDKRKTSLHLRAFCFRFANLSSAVLFAMRNWLVL